MKERINDTKYFDLHCNPYLSGIYLMKWKFFPSLENADDASELNDVIIIGTPITNNNILILNVGS